MKLCKTEQLRENNIIASSVLTKEYQVLLTEGTILKKEYIEKLKEFNITEVFIREDIPEEMEDIAVLKKETEALLKGKVKQILEKHTYQHNQELKELMETADFIIEDILQEEKIVEKVFDIKERSADIYEHSTCVCTLSIVLGMKLEQEKEVLKDIAVGALLHDIGLRYITLPYQNTDINQFSDFEKVEFRKHPVYAYTALRDEIWISERSKNIILYHHERMDSSGFPLKASKIAVESQIVSVCDVFDEMICGIGCVRSKVYEAIEYLKFAKGKYYRSDIVNTFLKITAVYPVGTIVQLNDGRIATVIHQNNQFPERPILKTQEEEEMLDLVKINNVYIDKVL